MLSPFFLFFRISGSSSCVGVDCGGFGSTEDCSGAIVAYRECSLCMPSFCLHRGVLGNRDMSGGKRMYGDISKG